MKILRTFLPLALMASPLLSAEDAGKGTWTDPVKAAKENPDFSIQGEYHLEGAPVAAQVVALGNGVFDAYILEGGLPGLGWKKGDPRVQLRGNLEEGIVTFTEIKGTSALLDEGHLTIQRSGKDTVKVPRIARQSGTLDAKPPKGAKILFDGKNTDQWDKGQIENGLLKSTGTTSIPKFKSYQLHLEFRTPFKPTARGQGRGNSGVYFGGRWETQVLDSFALDGKMNECGGIYSIAAPSVNMCLPPLTWQTYDVEFTNAVSVAGKKIRNARMTVKHNGVVIHDDLEIKGKTGGARRDPEGTPGVIKLQGHGNPMQFRNIWIQVK